MHSICKTDISGRLSEKNRQFQATRNCSLKKTDRYVWYQMRRKFFRVRFVIVNNASEQTECSHCLPKTSIKNSSLNSEQSKINNQMTFLEFSQIFEIPKSVEFSYSSEHIPDIYWAIDMILISSWSAMIQVSWFVISSLSWKRDLRLILSEQVTYHHIVASMPSLSWTMKY